MTYLRFLYYFVTCYLENELFCFCLNGKFRSKFLSSIKPALVLVCFVERVCGSGAVPIVLEWEKADDRNFRHEPQWLIGGYSPAVHISKDASLCRSMTFN